MTIKKITGFLHLWLGLASGLVIFIVCTTAAIWAFSPEIENATQGWRHVKQGTVMLPVSRLKSIAETKLSAKANSVFIEGKKKAAIVYSYGDNYYYAVYVNPYTGNVLKVRNESTTFFRFIITGHYTLWLGETGGQMVKWATLIFLVMLISGIVLWWPRNKAARRQRFKVKWNASPKRLNYDLHNVFGFYASWILIFAVLTGLVWTFESVAKLEYWIGSGGKTAPEDKHPVSVVSTDTIAAVKRMDSVFQFHLNNTAASINFPDSDSAIIEIAVFPKSDAYYNGDYYHYDQYTLKELPVNAWGKYSNANGGEKLSRMNYDIHIGSLLGLPGRIAMFFAVLIGASLPITGFYIWRGRNKVNKKKAKP